MTDVKQTIVGDSTNAQKAYADLARQVAKLEVANQKLASAADGVGKGGALARLESLTKSGIRQVSQLAGEWGGVGAVINAATMKLAEFQRLSEQARTTHISAGEAQANYAINLSGSTSEQKAASIRRLQEMQGDFPDANQMFTAAARIASTNGGNIANTEATIKATLPLVTNDPEALGVMGQAASDIKKHSGGKVSDEESLGLLYKTQTEAHISDPKFIAKTLPPVIGAAVAHGGDMTPEKRRQAAIEGAAIFSSLTHSIGEDSGELSKSAGMKLLGKLDEMFTVGIEETLPGTSFKRRVKPKFDPQTPEARMEVLRNDKKLLKTFEDNLSVEEVAKLGVHQLFHPRSEQNVGRKMYDSGLANINYGTDQYQQNVREQRDLTPQIKTSRMAKQTDANRQQADLRNNSGAWRAEADRLTDEQLTKTERYGNGVLGVLGRELWKYRRSAIDNDADALQADKEVLEERREQLRYKGRSLLGGKTYFDKRRDLEEYSPKERDLDQSLIQAIQQLDETMKEIRQSNQGLLEAEKEKRPSAGPAVQMQRGAHAER